MSGLQAADDFYRKANFILLLYIFSVKSMVKLIDKMTDLKEKVCTNKIRVPITLPSVYVC